MSIELNGLSAQQQLSEIAKMAYGSGKNEASLGGAGNIGILNGRVVKFNTHWKERLGRATDAMRASSDALRTSLMDIATTLLKGADGEVSPLMQETLAKIRRELGLKPDGTIANRKLLDRTVVARVVSEIDKVTQHKTWSEVKRAAGRYASTGVDTHFAAIKATEDAVEGFLTHLDADIDAALVSVAHPEDGKAGVTLNAEETQFLKDLIREDIAVRRNSGEALPTADEIKSALKDFSSPALVTTLMCFNRVGRKLEAARTAALNTVTVGKEVLAGIAPKDRKDLARVAMMLHGLSSVEKLPDFMVLYAFAAENLSYMRELQPTGTLTMDTVWRACFLEPAPEGTAPSGSPETAKAFSDRMDKLITVRIGEYNDSKQLKASFVKTVMSPDLMSGKTFSAALDKQIGKPGYVFDAKRDMLTYPPLYVVDNAKDSTDAAIADQLKVDFVRQNHLRVTFVSEPGAEPEVFEMGQDQEGDLAARTEKLIAKMKSFAGAEHEGQYKVACYGLSQAGLSPFGAVLGVGGEHSSCYITVSKNSAGGLTLHYESIESCPQKIAYNYEIAPDGASHFGDEYIVEPR